MKSIINNDNDIFILQNALDIYLYKRYFKKALSKYELHKMTNDLRHYVHTAAFDTYFIAISVSN